MVGAAAAVAHSTAPTDSDFRRYQAVLEAVPGTSPLGENAPQNSKLTAQRINLYEFWTNAAACLDVSHLASVAPRDVLSVPVFASPRTLKGILLDATHVEGKRGFYLTWRNIIGTCVKAHMLVAFFGLISDMLIKRAYYYPDDKQTYADNSAWRSRV
ncbi:homogentisate 1 [Colletotrichum scovillei]|nr:homogentisate 1 [Colletotrichum scovillei]